MLPNYDKSAAVKSALWPISISVISSSVTPPEIVLAGSSRHQWPRKT
jgi:hypothetical protein